MSNAVTFDQLVRAPKRPRIEPLYVTLVKQALYAIAVFFYLHPLSSMPGIISGVLCAILAVFIADLSYKRRLRLAVALIAGPALLFGAVFGAERLLGVDLFVRLFGPDRALAATDVLGFGVAALALVFVLRLLSSRFRVASVLEVAFVIGSFATTLADHRHGNLHRPRFLSDWSWSLGIDPGTVLLALGLAVAFTAVLLFLRRQTLLKTITTVLVLMLLGFLSYQVDPKPPKPDDGGASNDPIGLGKGKGDKGKGANGPANFSDNYDNPNPPQPVAVALLRDDYVPDSGVIYFRQRTLSKYNGVNLVGADAYDKDVITKLPAEGSAEAKGGQVEEAHTKLPTTMVLMVDHPQPPALSHAQKITQIENPNPQRFVSAYEVESLILSVPARRLLGRQSIPETWSQDKRKHYLDLPNDPRYQTLGDIITRQLEPRFAHDDLAKAFAIKRYLEAEGFYTRRSKHSSSTDPTASFLFGSLRGYCVHFAHAATYLFRSQGIAARVALGYAVQTIKRAGGSSIVIMGDRAHAWPEIYIDGIGWMTFDIYPEQTDMQPGPPVDYDLERMLGELARKDKTAGVQPDQEPLLIPWGVVGQTGGWAMIALLLCGYLIKFYRRMSPTWATGAASYRRASYRALLDRLSDLGQQRRPGETRERHARRLAKLSPDLIPLTSAHMAHALGGRRLLSDTEWNKLVAATKRQLKQNTGWFRRMLGSANPISWVWTR